MSIVQNQRPKSRIVDISFNQENKSTPVYLVKSVQGDALWELSIDADSGQRVGDATRTSLRDLDQDSRVNLAAFKAIRQEMIEAVIVAEKGASGKPISAGLLSEGSRLNFSVVVVVGENLKQVILEPPHARLRRSQSDGR